MHITGERKVPAPRERVWRCLSDPSVLQSCMPGSRIGSDGQSLLLSGNEGTSVRAQPTIREPFATLGWRIDPAGAATQMILVRLVEQGVFTLMQYEVSLADKDGEDTPVRTENLQAQIDQALERLVSTIAGTGEIAAGGIAGAVQAVTEPSDQPNARIVPAAPAVTKGASAAPSMIAGLMNPLAIGSALFVVVLLFMVGLL